jgi:hypothetical protein
MILFFVIPANAETQLMLNKPFQQSQELYIKNMCTLFFEMLS